jgi:curved DNA-binding protein CbpA
MKDYYQIMDVAYDASQLEIRTAYHKLAKKYHPDKNPDSEIAASLFIEIQEAYFVLSDEERRQQFHLRSKYPVTARSKATAETPDSILNKARKLNTLLKEIDVYRMNTSIFSQAVHLLLSESNIAIITSSVNQRLNRQIVEEILPVYRFIPYEEALRISIKLSAVAGHDEALQQDIHRLTEQKRIRNIWEKYNPHIIILITLILLLFILILSK